MSLPEMNIFSIFTFIFIYAIPIPPHQRSPPGGAKLPEMNVTTRDSQLSPFFTRALDRRWLGY
jgi:hypothetical protein